MPVSKMHYSMLTQLLRNPLIFKLKYILGVYEGKMGISGLVGQAGHMALQVYYGGNVEVPVPGDHDEAMFIAIDHGAKFLENYNDNYIEFGKTGSREEMLKRYHQAMRFYFAEEPQYNEVMYAETKMEAEIKTVDGDLMPLPAVGKPDLVHRRKDGGVEIVDIKFVKSFTDWDSEDWVKIIQSQFLWHLLRAAHDINADRMIFREVKVTENQPCKDRDKPPADGRCERHHDAQGCHLQIQDWEVPFSHEQYRIFFYNIYNDAVNFIANPKAVYLPNLSDPFDGEHAGFLYSQGLINGDMSDVEVMHKVKDVAFTSKKFIASRLDKVENQHLLPEEKIKLRLAEFGIPVEPVETVVGQTVTQYRFKVSAGIRMSTFKKHKDDIARAIEAKGEITLLAPIPGTGLVGVEVANENRTSVKLAKEHLHMDTLILPIGMTINGVVQYAQLNEMPHLLIAGSTGSGKSILLHSIIHTLTKQMKPSDMELVLIDPKRVELAAFSKSKHLKGKVLYEYKDVVEKLTDLVNEMEQRYQKLEMAEVRDITEYNATYTIVTKKGEVKPGLPYIVVVIDEYADFMLRSKQDEKRNKEKVSTASVEHLITRLAQMARAVGIHLIIATQRPSVDVITGLIKANFPTRIALTTASATDSQIILGETGAEKLTGKGDMYLMHPGIGGKTRLQGFLI